jgi:phenylpyruvate tautomerase PptA (4-oxalocrotonate tautomerase family)
MPNIILHVPKGALPVEARKALLREVTAAAAKAERIPADPKYRATTWVVLHEVDDGSWGGSGKVWTLVDMAKAAGYEHLQHLVPNS